MDELNEEDWNRLLALIERDNCILLLGPGASLDFSQTPPAGITEVLANSLLNCLKKPAASIDSTDLPHVAQLYERQKKSHLALR